MLLWWAKAPRIYFLTLAWALFILLVSAAPGKELPQMPFNQMDKLMHALVYGILALLTAFALKALGKQTLLGVFLLCCGYGLAIEWMQGTFFAGRVFDLYDALANGLGAILGIVIYRRLH